MRVRNSGKELSCAMEEKHKIRREIKHWKNIKNLGKTLCSLNDSMALLFQF